MLYQVIRKFLADSGVGFCRVDDLLIKLHIQKIEDYHGGNVEQQLFLHCHTGKIIMLPVVWMKKFAPEMLHVV